MTRPALMALLLAAGCATTGPDPSAKVTIVTTLPEPGTTIDATTRLRVVGDYSLEDFAPGKDRITLVFKSAGGRTWEPQELLLEKAKGRVIFEVGGDQILKQPSLVRPLQILLVIDRQEAPEKVRSLRASETVVLSADPAKANQARLEEARLLPPHIGKGQLLSDVANDPRVKPTLPMALNRAGNKVWGIYKVCVDNDGDVFDVKMLKSAHFLVDASWMALIRRFRHKPYSINGVAVPYCYPLRLEVRAAAE
ncbi:MAG TPA: hypothetical protein VN914_11565 [Polyangia bacterium]|nr:hypothetical protein [Polyangia bacterium]